MLKGNLLDWEIFKNNPNILNDFRKVHVFNWGESAFLIRDNEIYAYGKINPCFRGLGPTTTPKEIRFLGNGDIEEIATGLEHAVLLDTNDVVYCWGNNDHGQLGCGNTLSNLSFKEHQLRIIKISCGQFCTLALSSCNEVWFWGRQYNATIRGKIRAVPTLIQLPDYVDVDTIIAGCGDAAILDTQGTIYVWGFNGCGQLAQGHKNVVSEPRPVLEIGKCKHVIIARNRTAFVTENGKFCIGGSDVSQDHFELQQIYSSRNIISIAASWCKDLFAIKNDRGEILQWQPEAPSAVTVQTQYANIIEVFKDLWTPSIEPSDGFNRRGIMYHVPRTIRSDRSVKLNTCISKANSSNSKPDSFIDVSNHFNEEICSDLTIKLSDGNIFAHKLVLYTRSKYFKSLIENSSKDMKMVDMSNWSLRSYTAYVKYLYTGKFTLEAAEDLPEVHSLAEQDSDTKLQDECMTLWRKNLKVSSVISMFHSAYIFQHQIFLQECGALLKEHLPTLIATNEYLRLPESVKLSLALTVALMNHC